MYRRLFLGTIAGSGLASMFAATPKGYIIELRHYSMRNNSDAQMQRTSEFIEKYAETPDKIMGFFDLKDVRTPRRGKKGTEA